MGDQKFDQGGSEKHGDQGGQHGNPGKEGQNPGQQRPQNPGSGDKSMGREQQGDRSQQPQQGGNPNNPNR